MSKTPSKDLIRAIAVTAELTQTQMSAVAAEVMASDLSLYSEAQVMKALTRCRRELSGPRKLTIAEVINRFDDGRPGAEEAWAMIPRDESATVVWTEEMATAFGVVAHMLKAGEDIPARMAFKEKYLALVSASRDEGSPVKWQPSLGVDPHGRESALAEAVRLGRIPAEHALALLPSTELHQTVATFLAQPKQVAA